MVSVRTFAALAAALAVSGCGDDSPDPSAQTTNPPVTHDLEYSGQVSECGGFPRTAQGDLDAGDAGDDSYCLAEVLAFRYEGSSLILTDSRVELNCCGSRNVEVIDEGGVVVVKELDYPGAGRCRCTCVFDFQASVEVPKAPLTVRVVRDTKDGAGLKTVWEGPIDPSLGSGSVTVDPNPSAICH